MLNLPPLGLAVTTQAVPPQRLTQDIAKGIGEEALMRDKPRTLSTMVLDTGGDMFHVNIIQPWRNHYQQYCNFNISPRFLPLRPSGNQTLQWKISIYATVHPFANDSPSIKNEDVLLPA